MIDRSAMAAERFRTLAQSYGCDLDRWPRDEQAAARELASEEWAAELLHCEGDLDLLLDGWKSPSPSTALIAAIAASAPPARGRRVRNWRLWWSGLGVAAALSGIAAGSLATAATASRHAGSDLEGTAFGDLDQEGNE